MGRMMDDLLLLTDWVLGIAGFHSDLGQGRLNDPATQTRYWQDSSTVLGSEVKTHHLRTLRTRHSVHILVSHRVQGPVRA